MGVIVFDLDQTVVDSSHRTPRLGNGDVDVEQYIRFQTEEYIRKDSLLPISQIMLNSYSDHHIVVCTARCMTDFDYIFLDRTLGLRWHEMYERGTCDPLISKLPDEEYKAACLDKFVAGGFTFYDDNDAVISRFSSIKGVHMIDAKIENARLTSTS